MPGARKDTTPVAIENPIYIGRVAELGDNYTVVFETIRVDIDTAPIFKGTAGRPLSLPTLGDRRERAMDCAVRRSQGDVRGGRCVLLAARPPAAGYAGHRAHHL
jgi:hypothetical protein